MADCWNTTTSGFMEDRTSLRIVVGKDHSNQVSNQRPRKWVGIYTITTRTVAPVYIAMSQIPSFPVPANLMAALATQSVTHAKAEWMPWTTFVQQHWPAIRNFSFVRPSREHALIPTQHRCFNDEDGTDDALENYLQGQGLDDESYRTWLYNIVPTLEQL
ncbi:hypothetical protein K469DRAFT_702359 [Zopfia rhizophila CBS 207.26]|uniref:Uncharacterized protein n=1 Tax=Zopfia rhizophila CBS 207.26 TaxID=1314779 RepID=A0A6A6D8B5_9PEZI|nr:hypothetical protein K469DRAFT_702359 [Zopfia rhizophila CBS 207.26]